MTMGLKEAKERVETALESDNHKLALIKLIRAVYVEGMEASGNSVMQADELRNSVDDYLQQVTSQAAEIDTLWRIVNRLIDRINAK